MLKTTKKFVMSCCTHEPKYYRHFFIRRALNILDFTGQRRLASSVAYSFAWHNNEANMKAQLQTHRAKGDVIPAIYDEDYSEIYGCTDYKGKAVLDVGADIGGTAQYFIKQGARHVFAVEGSSLCYRNLLQNIWNLPVTPVNMFITAPWQFSYLITKFKPDILKSDIEGGETHLFQIDDATFKIVPEYVVEVHSAALLEKLKVKCARNGYSIRTVYSAKLAKGLCDVVYVSRLMFEKSL